MTRRALVLLATLAPCVAFAGPDAGDVHDDNPDAGPAYFGFVKDSTGVPVRDARVTASYKGEVAVLARTNISGAYKLHVFKKDLNPDDVVISCAKEGYRQVRIVRFPPPRGKPVKSVETECRLQREKS